MAQAISKAAQKRIAKLAAFLAACGVKNAQDMDSPATDLLQALIGPQSRRMKKFLVKAGWRKIGRVNCGDGEFSTTYKRKGLTGSIEFMEYRGEKQHNTIFLHG